MSTTSSVHSGGSFALDGAKNLPRSPSNLSMMSGFSCSESVAAQEAQVLSRATSTATIAAKSILISGGDSTTALKTAKAAAQSVLIGALGSSLGSGPKSILRKRKIKKQAEIVASMALVSASDSLSRGEWNDSMSRDDESRNPRQLDIAYDDAQSRDHSTITGLTRPSPAGTLGTRPGLPPKPPSVKSSPSIPSSFVLQSEPKEDSMRDLLERNSKNNDDQDDDQMARVAISVETNRDLLPNGGGPSSMRSSNSNKERRDPIATVKDEDTNFYGSTVDGACSSEGEQQQQYGTDDDITSGESLHTTEDQDPLPSYRTSETYKSNASLGTASIAAESSFMHKNVDPIMTSFSSVFPCFICETVQVQSPTVMGRAEFFPASRTRRQKNSSKKGENRVPFDIPEDLSSSTVSSVRSDELLRGLDYETMTETEDEVFSSKFHGKHRKKFSSPRKNSQNSVNEYDGRSEDSSYTRDDLESDTALESGDSSEFRFKSTSNKQTSRSSLKSRGQRGQPRQGYYD